MTLFPNFQPLPQAISRSDHYRLNSDRVHPAEIRSRATTWMGPPRAASASARVDLEIVPARNRRGRGNGRGANRDGHDADSPSLNLGRSHFSDDSSSSSDDDWLGPRRDHYIAGGNVASSDDWLGPRREDEVAGSNSSSHSGNPPSQANSSSRNIRSPSNRQPGAQDDGSAGNIGSSSGRSSKGQNSGAGSLLQQQGFEPDRSEEDIQDGGNDEKPQSGQSSTDQDMQDLIDRAPDISPSSLPLSGQPSGFSLDPGCDPLSSQIDMRRINVSPAGIGMNSDEEDDDHDHDEDGDDRADLGATPVANPSTNNQNIRQNSTASAIARGEAARQALRSARRPTPGLSRLARVLARLRIRPLPPVGPAHEPHPAVEQAQRAARSSRFYLSRILRPGAAPAPAPSPVDRQTRRRRRPSAQQPSEALHPGAQQSGPLQTVHVLPLQTPAPIPGAAGQPRNRLRRVGRLPERPRLRLSNSQQRNRISRPDLSNARLSRSPPIAGQPRSNRSRRSGRLPEWRSPLLGSQQGIPYPNAVSGQPQSIPVVPAADNAANSPPYINVEGANVAPNPAEVPVAVGGGMPSDVIPVGDPRHLARAYAGEAVLNVSAQNRPDTIWYTPSVDVRPVPGYFQSQWTILLGVQRFVYFYRLGSEGANAVLATRLQNPI